MKKRLPGYIELEGMVDSWAVVLPSKYKEQGYKEEEELLEMIVKENGLESSHKNFVDYMESEIDSNGEKVGVVSQQMIDIMKQYVYIDEISKDYFLLFYDVKDEVMNDIVSFFAQLCEKHFGYTWE